MSQAVGASRPTLERNFGRRDVGGVRVFVAGGSGVLGRRLVPQLVARGHRVTATTTGPGKLGLLEDLGAHGVVLDGLDGVPVGEAVATVRPDAIVHVMTALSSAHAGAPDVRHMDQWFGPTNRLRTEGTDNLLAAAAAADVRHVVAQSHANWNGIRGGGWVKIEDDPLDMHEGTVQNAVSVSIRHLEDVVLAAGGAVLRYGAVRGRLRRDGGDGAQAATPPSPTGQWLLVMGASGRCGASRRIGRGAAGAGCVQRRRRRAGTGQGLAALSGGVCGCEAAPPDLHVAGADAGRDVPVIAMTEGRGFSNRRARSELGWTPHCRSWRRGCREGLQ
jgi:putative NAD(P)-binding protein